MQILLGANETIIRINSNSISIDYIQHFITTHFEKRQIKENYIFIPESNQNIYHRTFLLKWLYSLHSKKNTPSPKLKELLINRQHKAIKIITKNKIIHTLDYKIIDKENLIIHITPANNNIAVKIKTYLQLKITIMPIYLKITLTSIDDRKILKKFIQSNNIIDIPHHHKYNKKDMDEFLFLNDNIQDKTKQITPIQNAYNLLGISKDDSLNVIKKKYKLLAKKFHPDNVYGKDKHTLNIYTKKFQKILGAYEMITYTKIYQNTNGKKH